MEEKRVIAKSPYMKKLLGDLPKVAKSRSSVFIIGESGTGKEVIAEAIHSLSNRKDAPFIKVNCAAIPDSLLESEFFGHEKGAFTGAISKRLGRFELANHGTLLLDEVSEIPLSLQSKLLRAVQEQEFERVGGSLPVKTDVRFIATSNRNMQEAIQTNQFRGDLFYRLNVVPLYLPPLRERKEDILPLAEHFLKRHTPTKTLSKSALEKLLAYSWPGNIRELSNVIEHSVVMGDQERIEAEDLQIAVKEKRPLELPEDLSLKEVERLHILKVLALHENNKTKAAQALGISVRTLRNKLALWATQSTIS